MEIPNIYKKQAIEAFKVVLVANNSEYVYWKKIEEKFFRTMANHNPGTPGSIVLALTKQLRQKFFKIIQNDQDFIATFGMLISKNSVGIKITKNLDEIKEYVDGEDHRGVAILVKTQKVRNYLRIETARQKHRLDFGKEGQ